jgi:hypothetical protein
MITNSLSLSLSRLTRFLPLGSSVSGVSASAREMWLEYRKTLAKRPSDFKQELLAALGIGDHHGRS